MMDLFKVRKAQGWQTVPDVRKADPKGFRGLPKIGPGACAAECRDCVELCPTKAIQTSTAGDIQIDLGLCTFCGHCEDFCPTKKIRFTSEYKMGASSRESLIIDEKTTQVAVQVNEKIRSLFHRSLRLRSVSAAGCNGCELEMNALSNVNFDIGRFGIEFVASPRHADAIVLTGPISKNMSEALRITLEAIPQPRFIIAVGACAISGGLYRESVELDRSLLDKVPPVLFVPGCPPHPLTFLTAILDLLGREK